MGLTAVVSNNDPVPIKLAPNQAEPAGKVLKATALSQMPSPNDQSHVIGQNIQLTHVKRQCPHRLGCGVSFLVIGQGGVPSVGGATTSNEKKAV